MCITSHIGMFLAAYRHGRTVRMKEIGVHVKDDFDSGSWPEAYRRAKSRFCVSTCMEGAAERQHSVAASHCDGCFRCEPVGSTASGQDDDCINWRTKVSTARSWLMVAAK